MSAGASTENSSAAAVGVADTVEAHNHGSLGQVRPGHKRHQVFEASLGVGYQVAGGANYLHQVMWSHIGGHTHRNAACAIN